ncbi:toxin PIN [Enterococcus durans]|uniref:toxin PIN n=1 Tax=Enterococcus durans TaxID=53345 RepID=UPI003BEF2A46
MNNRHHRVVKLKKQELNAAKANFERQYGISAEEAARSVSVLVNEFGRMVKMHFLHLEMKSKESK